MEEEEKKFDFSDFNLGTSDNEHITINEETENAISANKDSQQQGPNGMSADELQQIIGNTPAGNASGNEAATGAIATGETGSPAVNTSGTVTDASNKILEDDDDNDDEFSGEYRGQRSKETANATGIDDANSNTTDTNFSDNDDEAISENTSKTSVAPNEDATANLLEQLRRDREDEDERYRKNSRRALLWQSLVGIGEAIARGATGASGEMTTPAVMQQTNKDLFEKWKERRRQLGEDYNRNLKNIENERKWKNAEDNLRIKESQEKDRHDLALRRIAAIDNRDKREEMKAQEEIEHKKRQDAMTLEKIEIERGKAEAAKWKIYNGGGSSGNKTAVSDKARARKKKDNAFVGSIKALVGGLGGSKIRNVADAIAWVKKNASNTQAQKLLEEYNKED